MTINEMIAKRKTLLDTMDGFLDTHKNEELHRLFFDLRSELGQTFIIVTHDETLAATTDRTIRLRDGLVVDEQ